MERILKFMSSGRVGRTLWPLALLPLMLATALSASAQAAPEGAANLPAGPGRDEFAKSCSQCHALGTSTGKRRTADDWHATIQNMIGRGAEIDAAQAEIIQKYLVANFSPQQGSAPAMVGNTSKGPDKAMYPRPTGDSQWPTYGGTNANQNYSKLTQITPQNVSTLKKAWTYHFGAGEVKAGDQGLDYRFEVQPLLVGGIMYISTPSSPAKPDVKASISAIEPETGTLIWKYESPLNIHGRGIAYWPGDATIAPRIIFATDQGYIMAVDVTTGKLAKDFGRGGVIDAYAGVTDEVVGESRRGSYTVPNPVTVYKDVFIIAGRPGEQGPPAPRGDLRAFSTKTGRLVWDFHTIPQPGEPGHEVYKGDEWRDLSGANVWSTMTLDDQNGILYAATGDLNSFNVSGSHLYADSLLALDANTGKLKWFHQITHHDIWDWDSPTPPVLMTTKKNGKDIPTVALTGKHSLFFLFDRLTGAPLNGFNEKPVPQPKTPNPSVFPTQPFPDAPGPLARVQMTRDEVPDLAPGMKAACQAQWDAGKTVSGPLYTLRTAEDHATITYPSSVGGPNWGGASFIPDQHLFFINVMNRVTFRPATPGSETGLGPEGTFHASSGQESPMAGMPGVTPATAPRTRGAGGARPPQAFTFTTADGVNLSCGALPWGEMVAVDVETHKIAWRVPLGMTEGIGAAGENTGTANLGGSIATESGVIFIGATNDRRFRAFDAKTGKKLWETTLDASGAATPITYMGKDGKQYVVIAAGGGTSVGQKVMSDELVAFTLQ